ncbi:MAG TPA: thermonuclease family protein [Enhygromyxa sp.]|nr:thermonuclease family protein [Enhygromyxa sp.]
MLYEYFAKLDRVVDGDTVWLNVDLGFRVFARLDFRLYGINAPEMVGATKTAALASKVELQRLLSQGPLTVRTHKADATDKYGRWLATITVDAKTGPVEVNEALVAGGFAVRYP